MKKKLLFILMQILPLVTCAYTIQVRNDDGFNIYYEIIGKGDDLELEVIRAECHGNLVIPEEVTYCRHTYKVTSIGCSAFSSDLTSITIPNSVTRIGSEAFRGCKNLTSITLSKNVTSIGSKAFLGCDGLDSIKVESGNTKYDSRDNCNAIIETANDTLIAGCKNTVIPKSVTRIGAFAFGNCRSLTSIVIPNSVTSIGDYAFWECSGLTSITIPNSVTSIGNHAFEFCYSLSSITIPNSVTSIASYAFSYCRGLTSVTIPNSVTSIDVYAFFFCSSLTSVIIPKSVTSIGYCAFQYCTSLTTIAIPDGIMIIEPNTFSGCSSLTSVIIPKSVIRIAVFAFEDCDISEVISKIERPFEITRNTFSSNTYNKATLYVPIGTIDEYKNKDGWKYFNFIEEGVPSGIEQSLSKIRQIQSEDGVLTIQNIKNGTYISVYNANGTFVGSTISKNEQAKIDTNMQPGSIAIVKIGEQSVKMIIK